MQQEILEHGRVAEARDLAQVDPRVWARLAELTRANEESAADELNSDYPRVVAMGRVIGFDREARSIRLDVLFEWPIRSSRVLR